MGGRFAPRRIFQELRIKFMLQSFIIVLREGFESFLLVAVILAYLRKTSQKWRAPPPYSAAGASIAGSAGIAYWFKHRVYQTPVRSHPCPNVGLYLQRVFADVPSR